MVSGKGALAAGCCYNITGSRAATALRAGSQTRPHPWMISRSATGSTRSSTCTTSGSSKALHTWKMPSTPEMWLRKLFPSPSPAAAPLHALPEDVFSCSACHSQNLQHYDSHGVAQKATS